MNLERLLHPQSIAVVGGRQAAEVVNQCQRMGFQGDIWPVHPGKTEVAGLPVFRSIAELPGSPDATFIGVNRELTVDLVKALVERGAGGAVCYASGFLEADAKGAVLQEQLLDAAGDMPILGPNCYGLINYVDGALLWPDQHGGWRLAADEKGVVIITQSSNLSISLTMQQRGLPLAYMLTAGNQAQIGLSQLALAVLEDPQVTALGLHIEGFDSIPGMEALSVLSRRLNKPVLVLKVGKSEQAQQAALTHTASLAGSHAASQAFLKRLGFGQVDNVPALMESLKLLHVHGALAGYRLCSMSCSGGEASIMADSAQGRKVFYPELSAEQKAPVEAVLGERVTVNNPLDYHTYIWADQAGMQAVYQNMMAIGFDLSLLLLDFPHPGRCDDADWQIALQAFIDAAKNSGAKAAITATLPENIPEAYIQHLMQNGIVALSGLNEALQAAEVAADIGQAWSEPLPDAVMGAYDLADAKPQTFTEAEAKEQLWEAGLKVPAGQRISPQDDLAEIAEQLTYPLALKALGIAHKTESNAVHLNLQNAQEVLQAAQALWPLSNELYLEAMVQKPVLELLVGLQRDAHFGLVMTLGAGGIWVEILRDSATLLLPCGRDDIDAALNALKVAPLLKGYRGKPVADIESVLDSVMALQQYALQHADSLLELDINPLMVCEAGQGAWVADALIVKTS